MLVTSPEIWVSDPCYSLDTWCTYTIKNARLGEWKPSVKFGPSSWGDRVHQIDIVHSNYDDGKLFYREVPEAYIGVDSGQAGFFDLVSHPRIEAEYTDDNFYGQICDQTQNDSQFLAHSDWYAVSSSGYGDGSYTLYVAEENGEVIAARIVFISDNDDEFEDDEIIEDEEDDNYVDEEEDVRF